MKASLVAGAALVLASSAAWAERAPEVLAAEGELAYEAGEHERAAALLAEALEGAPSLVRAAHCRGLALLALEDWEGAVEALEPAARAAPDDAALALDLGLAYLHLGNLSFAGRELERAVRLEPSSAAARHALGAALARQGDCGLAARQLAEARRLEPDLAVETRYLAGLCHARAGDLEAASSEVRPVIRTDLSGPLVEASRRFVRIALRAEGIETALVSASVGLSVGYDSNPTLAPEPADQHHSFSPLLELDATVRAFANERHTLAGRIGAYRSFPLPEAEARDYSFTLLAASAYYRLRTETGPARHELHLGYDFALGLFDGAPPLSDRHHLYSEHHGGRLAWTVRQSAALQSRLTVLVRHGRFAQLRRNNTGVLIGFGQSAAVAAGALILHLEATVRLEEARSADYDIVAPGLLAALTWTAPLRFVVSAWALYEHEDYPSSSEGRVDDSLTTSLGLERALVRHLALALSWSHTESFSTVRRFDYARDVVALTLWARL